MLIGVIIGVLFFFLAFNHVDFSQIQHQLRDISGFWIIAALMCYSCAIIFRISRWQFLISPIMKINYPRVGVALIIGYAVNNVIPARLGELYRADFCKRQFNLSRLQALGTIALERLADGMMVVMLFLFGMLFSHISSSHNQHVLMMFGFSSVALFGGVGIILYFLSHSRYHFLLSRWPKFLTRLEMIQHSIAMIRSRKMFLVMFLSIIIWSFDLGSLWAIVQMVGITLPFSSIMLLVGIVSMSTLLPSPPGYLGTLQFAFVLVFSFFHYSASAGIVAATAQQVVLMGYITIIGGILLLLTHFSKRFRGFLADDGLVAN